MNHTAVLIVVATFLICSLLENGVLSFTQSFASRHTIEFGQQPHGTNDKCNDECNSDDGHGTKQGIHENSNTRQTPVCITAGGNSPITDSCNNASTTGITNTGGNAAVVPGNSDDGHGTKQGIHENSNTRQTPVCITAGGNSPITDSCNNASTTGITNTGGNALLPLPS